MQVTLEIPDALAAQLTAAGLDPAVIAQEALSTEAFQHLLDAAALADEQEGVRQGDDDVSAGRTRPAREVFDEMRAHYAIPR